MLAWEELTKPATCASESVRSTSRSLPRLVTLATNADVLGAMAVVVEDRLAAIAAVAPSGDDARASAARRHRGSPRSRPRRPRHRSPRRAPACGARRPVPHPPWPRDRRGNRADGARWRRASRARRRGARPRRKGEAGVCAALPARSRRHPGCSRHGRHRRCRLWWARTMVQKRWRCLSKTGTNAVTSGRWLPP